MSKAIEALKALGSRPEGYCFCPKPDPNKGWLDHTGECKDALMAISEHDKPDVRPFNKEGTTLVQCETHMFRELTPELRPQDETLDGSTMRFVPLEHGGEYPDQMPQIIEVIDPQGRWARYEIMRYRGRCVQSHGFHHARGNMVVRADGQRSLEPYREPEKKE